jgi:hypothetical protein
VYLMSMTDVAHPYRPVSERINFRLITFISAFLLLLGAPIYLYLDSALTGGIKNYGDYFKVDLKAMSSFTFDQVAGKLEDVPPQWRELDGKRILLHGEIAPGGFNARGADGFLELVYSVQKCCFSGQPQIQHFVQVTVPQSADVKLTTSGEIEVLGQLKVDVVRDPETGKITGVYHLRAERVSSI